MLNINVYTEGFDRLRDQLNSLESDFKIKARKAGLREVGKTLKRDLQSTVPVQSGVLRRSISSKIMSRSSATRFGWDQNDLVVEAGAIRKVMESRRGYKRAKRYQTYIMRWLEYGTEEHMLKAWKPNTRPRQRYTTYEIRKMNEAGESVTNAIWHRGTRGRGYLQAIRTRRQNDYQNLFVAGAQQALAKYGVVVS